MSIKRLRSFIVKAHKSGYASGEDRTWKKEKDLSTTITYEAGDWQMHDNFFGGEPYGGREVVFYKNKPVWIMVYYGSIGDSVDTNTVYKVLRDALNQLPEDHPYRGPKNFTQDEYQYLNSWRGTLESFAGQESIQKNGEELYKANYMGGLVDKRSGV